MELKNCARCGQLFLYTGVRNICPDCVAEEEKEFELVKQYLWDHPKASLTEVSEGTGVKEERILRYLREGRISLADGSGIKLKCEICGAEIEYGRICAKCAKSLGLDGSYSGNKGKEKDSSSSKGEKLFTEHLLKREKR